MPLAYGREGKSTAKRQLPFDSASRETCQHMNSTGERGVSRPVEGSCSTGPPSGPTLFVTAKETVPYG